MLGLRPQDVNRQEQKLAKPQRYEQSTFRWLFGRVFSLLGRHGGAVATLYPVFGIRAGFSLYPNLSQ
jgi:hypothetical protein